MDKTTCIAIGIQMLDEKFLLFARLFTLGIDTEVYSVIRNHYRFYIIVCLYLSANILFGYRVFLVQKIKVIRSFLNSNV